MKFDNGPSIFWKDNLSNGTENRKYHKIFDKKWRIKWSDLIKIFELECTFEQLCFCCSVVRILSPAWIGLLYAWPACVLVIALSFQWALNKNEKTWKLWHSLDLLSNLTSVIITQLNMIKNLCISLLPLNQTKYYSWQMYKVSE